MPIKEAKKWHLALICIFLIISKAILFQVYWQLCFFFFFCLFNKLLFVHITCWEFIFFLNESTFYNIKDNYSSSWVLQLFFPSLSNTFELYLWFLTLLLLWGSAPHPELRWILINSSLWFPWSNIVNSNSY